MMRRATPAAAFDWAAWRAGPTFLAEPYPRARNAMYAKITAISSSATRPTPIIRVCATGRVPRGLIPVTAAMAATTTAIPNQASQLMRTLQYKKRTIAKD